jgi:nitric oxide dioxygenase
MSFACFNLIMYHVPWKMDQDAEWYPERPPSLAQNDRPHYRETYMPTPLSSRTIEIVKATTPALEIHGLTIVKAMYARMFTNPAIRDLFNQSHQGDDSQPRALAAAILAYAHNIENLSALTPAVERIAQKHVGLQILPEHYPHVGAALLGAIKEVLGDAASPEVLTAWEEAYWFLANVLIDRERTLYQSLEEAEGGWTGWRDFAIEEITPESAVITSFILRPTDGRRVIDHKPGQYLTFSFDLPGQGIVKRNYSISAAPNGETYRISVKREPKGLVSGWLHNEATPGTILKVAPPAGDFFLPDNPGRPVVLLSGGVGMTPMIAMLESITENHPNLTASFVHGAIDGSTHAMGAHVKSLADRRAGVSATIFYQSPRPEDATGDHVHRPGLINRDWLAANTPVVEADYYICGPRPFMRAMVEALTGLSVPADRIHYEFFGPADEVLAA